MAHGTAVPPDRVRLMEVAAWSSCSLRTRGIAACPGSLGRAAIPRAAMRAGLLLLGSAGRVRDGQVGAGRAQSRCQQVRKACFHGQVELIFTIRRRAGVTSRAGRCDRQ